jgi:hypothetical protein
MSVYAIDGSKYDLPATPELRSEFDPESGLNHEGKGHYPQCLVSTVYDVFRRFPVARSVTSIHNGSERQEAQELLPFIPPGGILLFDRGYPSFEFIAHIGQSYNGHFIFRCPAKSTFPAVETFLRTQQKEGYISLAPSNKYIQKLTPFEREKVGAIHLRIIKLVSPDGTVSVLLTNLLDTTRFPKEQIIDLYFRRWAVEGHYRDEKFVLDIEKFHGKSSNSIRQELFASMIMAVIARMLMMISSKAFPSGEEEFQFKNAIMNLASEAALLVPDDPQKAVQIFNELLREISRVKYYRPKSARPGQPRVSRQPINKWCSDRRKKLAKP